MNKHCRKCDTVKPVEGFGTKKSAKDGLQSWCKSCKKQDHIDNREKRLAAMKVRYDADPASHNKQTQEYYNNNHAKCRDQQREYRKHNPDKISERNKNTYNKNAAAIIEKNKKWAQENKDKTREYKEDYRKRNPAKSRALLAKRRANKLSATPEWLTKEHHDQILSKYEERTRLTQETGIEHHVDHIVPLRGKNICGLHVPWNLQVLTATENMKKSNSY